MFYKQTADFIPVAILVATLAIMESNSPCPNESFLLIYPVWQMRIEVDSFTIQGCSTQQYRVHILSMAQIVQYPADRTPAKSFVASLLAYCMHDPENTFLNPHHPSQTANFPFYLCTYLLIQLKRPMIY